MGADRRRLRTFLIFDVVTAATAVVIMAGVWLFVYRSPWLLVLSAMVASSALLMLGAVRPLRRGALEPAVRWLAVANWSIAIGATAIATFAWPLMVLAALLPAVFAMPYASGTALRVYLVVSLAASVVVAALGVLQDVTGFTSGLPDWVRDAVLIGFTPFLGGMIAQLGLEHSLHLNRALATAEASNERLRRSEEALVSQAAELRASRTRLVAATDRERRRIERDLHDGAQQRLVALSVRMSVARRTVAEEPASAIALLEELRAEVKAAQAELSRLAHGVYPPVLTEHGLAAALRSAIDRTPNPAETDIAEVGRHPREVETAIYFCSVEALQNVTKHAGPDAPIRVRLVAAPGPGLTFEIADAGPGFEPGATEQGMGFTNMRDRIGAIGGTVEVASTPGVGTTVIGRVPLPASPAG